MIIYGGSPEQIEKQKNCEHQWAGPLMDDVGRYYKCVVCFCLDRDETTISDTMCIWKPADTLEEFWNSGCGRELTCSLGENPVDAGFKFCPFCGRVLGEK